MARKASLSLMLGWFVVAIAGLAVAGFGFGFAQAGGNHTDGPVLSFKDQVALEPSDSTSPYVLDLPSAIDVDYGADGYPSSDVAQIRGTVETGALPERESDWRNVEALDSYFDYLPENRPVLAFDDMHLENSTETGRLPAESTTDSTIVEAEGNMYREAIEVGSLPAGSNADSSIVETEEDMYRGWEHDQWGL